MKVFLVGLMAAGKTSTACELSRRLGWQLLDCDQVVYKQTGLMRRSLLNQRGVAGLRDAEARAFYEAISTSQPAIATIASGVFLDAKNRRTLREAAGTKVWLTATPEVLVSRLTPEDDRPWLDRDPLAVLQKMARERNPWFEEVADLTIDSSVVSSAAAAEAVLEFIRKTPQ